MLEWINNRSEVYASTRAYDGKNLTLRVSGSLLLTVTHGGTVSYEGNQIEDAINVYNDLL